MKIYVKAMSTSQKDFKQHLQYISGKLTEHLLKLYLFPNSQYANHWKKEVWAFLHLVPKLKKNNKNPEPSFIFDNISIYVDQSESMMYTLMSEYPELAPERIDPTEAESMVEQYFEKLSYQLSENSSISSNKVEEILSAIGL